MKKSFTTIALFSLVLVATSFTTPEIVNSNIDPIDGGVSVGGGRKQDIYAQLSSTTSYTQPIDGGVSVGGGRKQDIYRAQLSSTANYNQPIDGGVSVGGGRKQD
ncbi:hypothetical protein OIU80_06815 [Flavobacterium sp. LS1R47]|uniref:Secreted protein n=1 Tax=Flavobacterium frigoritolerans TaxID=2987686 RepID=A0A9X3C0P2_9FLAO|nr:hypothetical protein [Flavobacterium frigoritolerans]MCV9931990.1 hypothetical protein [Flavobacterium frigoritolerans]